MSFIKTYGRCYKHNNSKINKNTTLSGLLQIKKTLSDEGFPNNLKLLYSEGCLFIEGYNSNNNRAIAIVLINNNPQSIIQPTLSGENYTNLVISSVSSIEKTISGYNTILWKTPYSILSVFVEQTSDLLSFVGENIIINPMDNYNTSFKVKTISGKTFIVDEEETFILIPVKNNKKYSYTATTYENAMIVPGDTLATVDVLNIEIPITNENELSNSDINNLGIEAEYIDYNYFIENFNGMGIVVNEP